MSGRFESQAYLYAPRIRIRDRPLHWLIMTLAYLFIFLLVLESIALIILGSWHLIIPRLQNVLSYSGELYRRELGFGILLIIVGSFGILISIIGIIALITLRLTLLRIFKILLFLLIILGIVVGIIGIIFATQVNGFMREDKLKNPYIIERNYELEAFLLGMNGGLAIFMSLTMLVGLIIFQCLTNDLKHYRRHR